VLLTNVVVLGWPLKWTTELVRKFAPSTVSVNALPPTTAGKVAGAVAEIPVTEGGALRILKLLAGETTPPGLATTTGTVPDARVN
jgi:hypothetical protein